MNNGIALLALALVAPAVVGCGQSEKPYEPKPAYSGDKRPTMPPVPALPNKPKKDGDAYTIWGASHDLNSVVHGDDFKDKQDVKITGYIVATNYEALCADKMKPAPGEICVPECAVHEGGKADPDGCKAPVPTFWIADDKAGDVKSAMRVMGWASNFAALYDVVKAIDKETDDAKKDAVEVMDKFFSVKIPVPLPIKGVKVKVTGSYGFNYSRSTAARQSDPFMGIMTYQSIEYVEKPTERAMLPGMKK
ncbi:MAG: hypothetical protein IT373_00535 [Polyangiaceae bacterium]|nr:hypothetical protein [Polyangiaceae bacterium]